MITRWCTHCLAVRSSWACVRAQYQNEEGQRYLVTCDYPSDTLALIKWLDACPSDTVFEIDQRNHAFTPIATYQGDPVCVVHLWELTDPMRKMR